MSDISVFDTISHPFSVLPFRHSLADRRRLL